MTHRLDVTHRLNPTPALFVRSAIVMLFGMIGASIAPISAQSIEIPRVLVTAIEPTEVPARQTGVLAKIDVRVGQLIQAGQTIAIIDDHEARDAVTVAEVEMRIAAKGTEIQPIVDAAQAAAEVAKRNLTRAQEAMAEYSRSLTESEMDEYRLKEIEASSQFWLRRHELEAAELTRELRTRQHEIAVDQLERHRLVAPISGMVTEVDRRLGEWVVSGQPVVRVQPLDRLRIVGFVNASMIRTTPVPAGAVDPDSRRTDSRGKSAGIRVGDPAMLDVPSLVVDAAQAGDAQGKTRQTQSFAGTVTFIDPQIEPESGQVKIWVDVENEDLRLRPGLYGTLTILNR